MLQIVTANRLGDGQVVFLVANGSWSQHITDAVVAADEPFAGELLATGEQAEHDCRVVAPYLIEVTGNGEQLQPVEIRETIRATGPTVACGPR